jgi:hypothetical protein
MTKAFPKITGETTIPSGEEVLFTNLEPLGPLDDVSLIPGKPDFYDGATRERLDKRIKEELGPYIIPSRSVDAPCLPNFFAEGKGPTGFTQVAKRQACYDGALGARAMHRLQSYGAETVYDNNAYTMSATYHHDGLLKMYAHHPTQPKSSGGNPEYHMTQLDAFAMTGTARKFREGATALRNAREWAKEQRDNFIAAANDRARNMPAKNGARSAPVMSPTAESSERITASQTATQAAPLGSDISPDELDPEVDVLRNTYLKSGDIRRMNLRKIATLLLSSNDWEKSPSCLQVIEQPGRITEREGI